jgi:hypothetical protein
MWLDLLALTLVCVMAGIGWARGALATGLGLATLGAGYAAAIAAGPRFGPGLAWATGAPGLLGTALAGALAFLLAALGVALVGRRLRAAEARRIGLSRSLADRLGGGAFGALRGACAALLVSLLALWLDALPVGGAARLLPPLEPSSAAELTGRAVEAGTLAALGDDPGTRVLARVASRPAHSLADLEGVLADERVLALRDDAFFWMHVEQGDVDLALHRASFVRLARDRALRERLLALGLVGEEAARDPGAFADALAPVLAEAGPRLRALREDPQLQQLLADPELIERVQAGDHLGLLAHPGFRAVLARAMEGEPLAEAD